jgi:methylglutaconyl-CoA hydratase
VNSPPKVNYRLEQSIARITLNRPEKRNALDIELLVELRGALQRSVGDESVRVVLLTGAGKDFCSGMDLRMFQETGSGDLDKYRADARHIADLFLDMRRHPRPIVAAVHGRALGGGCGIATAADIVLASQSAHFGYPEINIGFVAATVMAILRRSVGEKRAFDLISTGAIISAQAALEMGMITRVFSDDTFDREVEQFVSDISSKAPSAMAFTKELFYRTDGALFDSALAAGVEVNAQARATEDFRAGIARFLRKG